MAVERFIIRNFRSIENLELPLGPQNAFVGPNNSGKSNILRALNIMLGETYPTARAFTDRDFFSFDTSHPITLQVFFRQSLNPPHADVWGFSLTFDGNDAEFLAIDRQGNVATYASGTPKRVKDEMREQVALLYLGLNRQAQQQVRASQWTPYGKLLKHIHSEVGQPNRDAFQEEVTNSVNTHIAPTIRPIEEALNESVSRQTGLQLGLAFAAIDPVEVLRTLRPYFREGELTLDAEDVGAGTQSALAIAIARAYANAVRQPLILCIEEPELYLHPHGCRHFYKLLRELSQQGVQIVYATHERSLVGVSEYESIHLVRKQESTTVQSGINFPVIQQRERLQLLSKFDERINEVFFANYVVLAEGPADEVACRCALERLGLELDKRSISVVGLGGKGDLHIMARLLTGFSIPTLVLLDEDLGDVTTQAEAGRLLGVIPGDNLFRQRPCLENLFGLTTKPGRAQAIEFFPDWFSRHTADEIPSIYTELRDRLQALA